MSVECSTNDVFTTTYVERKTSSTGASETTIREYMNGAIYIESGTESDYEFVRQQKPQLETTKIKINKSKNDIKKPCLAKAVEKKIEKELELKEQRLQDAQKRYNEWLQKKERERFERHRKEFEELRDKEKQIEDSKKLRSIQSDLKFKLWLKRKEQKELEQQWMELKLLIETKRDK